MHNAAVRPDGCEAIGYRLPRRFPRIPGLTARCSIRHGSSVRRGPRKAKISGDDGETASVWSSFEAYRWRCLPVDRFRNHRAGIRPAPTGPRSAITIAAWLRRVRWPFFFRTRWISPALQVLHRVHVMDSRTSGSHQPEPASSFVAGRIADVIESGDRPGTIPGVVLTGPVGPGRGRRRTCGSMTESGTASREKKGFDEGLLGGSRGSLPGAGCRGGSRCARAESWRADRRRTNRSDSRRGLPPCWGRMVTVTDRSSDVCASIWETNPSRPRWITVIFTSSIAS